MNDEALMAARERFWSYLSKPGVTYCHWESVDEALSLAISAYRKASGLDDLEKRYQYILPAVAGRDFRLVSARNIAIFHQIRKGLYDDDAVLAAMAAEEAEK